MLPAGTYTLEATTPSGRSVSYFHLWYGIPRDLPEPQSTVWSATLNVAAVTGTRDGCSNGSGAGKECSSQLDEDSFTLGGTTYRVTNIIRAGNGLTFQLDTAIPQDLTLRVGDREYPLADATIGSAGTSATWGSPGFTWTAGQQVALKLTGPNPCVMDIDRGDTEAGMWKGMCHSTETLGAYARYYRYTPSAPGLIELFLTSRGAAEELFLYEGDTLIKQNSSLNWKRNGVYAWIHYSGAKAGVTYTIEVTTDSPGETGNYLLALRGRNYWLWNDSDFKPEGAPVVMPQGHTCVEDLGTKGHGDLRASGIWEWPCHSVEEPGSYARYYTFTLEEPKTVVVEVGSPHTWDAVLYLRAGTKGSGTHLAYSDNGHGVRAVDARLEVELQAGTYTIEAAIDVPGNGDGGHFVLYVKEPPPPWTPPAHCVTDIGRGLQNFDGQLTSGDGCYSYSHGGKNAHYYRFTLDRHADVGFTMSSDQVNSFLLLHEGPGISGPAIGQNDNYWREDARLNASLGPGTYILEVTTNPYSNRREGSYGLSTYVP